MLNTNIKYEKLGMIPPVFEKYFEDKDDKNLQENNANCSDIFLIKIDNGERKEINFNLNGLNSTIKIIMLIGENCDVNIKKILLQDGEDTGSVDFVTLVEKGTKMLAGSAPFHLRER